LLCVEMLALFFCNSLVSSADDYVTVTFGFHNRGVQHWRGAISAACAGTNNLQNPLENKTELALLSSYPGTCISGTGLTQEWTSPGVLRVEVMELRDIRGPIELKLLDGSGTVLGVLTAVGDVYEAADASRIVKKIRGTSATTAIATGNAGGHALLKVTVLRVNVINIDATSPSATIIKYKVTGSSLPSVTFTAPGKTETRYGIPEGEFTFTYDQNALSSGLASEDSRINSIDLLTMYGLVHIEVTRTEKYGDTEGVYAGRIAVDEYMINVPVVHSFHQGWQVVTYNVPMVENSKTVWLGNATVNITTSPSDAFPTDISVWLEKHRSKDSGCILCEQDMTLETRETLPPQTVNHKSQTCSDNLWIVPTTTRKGQVQMTALCFAGDTGPVVWAHTGTTGILPVRSSVPTD